MLNSLKHKLKQRLLPSPGKHLVQNFSYPDSRRLDAFAETLIEGCFASRRSFLATPEGQGGFENHLTARLEQDRRTVIPWLDDVRSLRGASVLEVGCGTGSSTVALAEQGARVTGLDLHTKAMEVAAERCRLYEVDADFVEGNVVEAGKLFPDRKFDFVIFYASLEHMTHEERLAGIRETWDLLSDDGLWCVIETPNRLWYHDGHTALMPYFMWLPDALALEYTSRSPRPSLKKFLEQDSDGNSVAGETDQERMLRFLRHGRGVSYHEFELALNRRVEDLRVVSSLVNHHRYIEWLRLLRRPRPLEVQYTQLLRKISPHVHRGFLNPQLDLILTR